MTAAIVQRAGAAATGFVLHGSAIVLGCPWWLPLALSVVLDLSLLGCRHGPVIGARVDNLVHSDLGPCLAGLSVQLIPGVPGSVVRLPLVPPR